MAENNNAPQRWLVVGSYENYEISRELGFTVQGVKTRARKKAHEIQPGDTLMYYLTGLMMISGIVTVESDVYEDRTPIWPCSSSATEVYPWRFKTKPLLTLADKAQFVSVRPLAEKLQYLTKWPAKNWTLGFQGNLHHWPEEDYQLVKPLLDNAANTVVA